jgi:hypothetical protein
VGFGSNVGGTEFSVNNTPTILGFVGMSMKSHLWCYEILEHITKDEGEESNNFK